MEIGKKILTAKAAVDGDDRMKVQMREAKKRRNVTMTDAREAQTALETITDSSSSPFFALPDHFR